MTRTRTAVVVSLAALASVFALAHRGGAATHPGAPAPAVVAQAAAPEAPAPHFPLDVKVAIQTNRSLGAMSFTDLAKLVSMMMASGEPSGAYAQARAAGIATVWYVDPHRIGSVAGKMSDRPPITALNENTDVMKCAQGGVLESSYSPATGTVFGDPTSANLIAQTNAQLATAAAHYGPVSYLWIDDAMLLDDQWADTWSCGTAAIAHGRIAPARIAYANGAPYTPQNFLAHLASFDDALAAPVLDEGACNGDGSDLGGSPGDGGATAALSAQARNSAGALCEDFAEGWGNRQTVDGKAVDQFWQQDLNSGIAVISAHKMFVNYDYIGDQGANNRGRPADADQRGYIYASFMLLYDPVQSVYMTGEWGAQHKAVAPAIVFPENLLVPLQPLTTAVWPRRVDALARGGAYVREFAACGYAGHPIGPCAAVVNPSSSNAIPLPALTQHYGHSVALTGDDGAFTGRHGTPNYGDDGDVDFTSQPVPATLPAAGWTILVR
jgi:hypothetical protein